MIMNRDDGRLPQSQPEPEPEPEPGPFEKFEQLTRQLVSVPKSEVDKARRSAQKRAGPVPSD